MRGHDIGKGLTLWLKHREAEVAAHDDVDAFYAPSECHTLVARGIERRARLVRRHIKAVTGLKWPVFIREVEQRTSAKWVHFHVYGGF